MPWRLRSIRQTRSPSIRTTAPLCSCRARYQASSEAIKPAPQLLGQYVGPDPLFEARLVHLSSRERGDDAHLVLLPRVEAQAVEGAEHGDGEEGGALVPVDEGVVAGDAEPVSRREHGQALLAPITVQVAGPVQGALQQSLVAHARAAAETRDRLVVERTYHGGREPARLLTWRAHGGRRGGASCSRGPLPSP